MNRRSFLRTTALAGATLPIVAGGSPLRAFAHGLGGSPFARAHVPPSDRVLVIIRLDGGNDGLNTLVPYHDDEYYRARGMGTASDISIHPERTTPIVGTRTLGLHPQLAPLAELFEERKVAVVQNVGYENPVMSHFRSTEIWMSATDAGEFVGSGWIARRFEVEHPGYPATLTDAPYAIEFGTRMSTAFQGTHGEIGVAHTEINYVPSNPAPIAIGAERARAERAYIESVMRQASTFSRSILASESLVTKNRVEYPSVFELAEGPRFASQLAETARLIASGIQTQVYLISLPFYDFHIRQIPRERAQHDAFARSVLAFQRDLEAFGVADRVAIMTMSEFGRRVDSRGSSGTDHGGAAPLLVIGTGVEGGFIGHDPDVVNVVGPGNLANEYDFRQVYASVLGQWLGASDEGMRAALLGRAFEQLPIFRTANDPETVPRDFLGKPTPNPAIDRVTIDIARIRSNPATLTLVTADGRRVCEQSIWPGESTVTLDVRSLPDGVYFCRVQDGERSEARGIVVRR
jgi:uncharacterized protein (DUF1501 family)